jgi:hypothetical protein
LWFLSTPSSLSPELQKTGLPPPEWGHSYAVKNLKFFFNLSRCWQ